jgi:molybdate transport system substrate-binding protein
MSTKNDGVVREQAMAETIQGVSSMATRQILADLAGQYEGETGRKIDFKSMGGVVAAQRIRNGEPFDIAVLAADALERLEAENHILSGSRTGFARSGVAMAVAAGSPHPRLNDEDDVRSAILAARAIAYSTGPSGAHLVKLMETWGVRQIVSPRLILAPPGVPVGALIARGDAEIGFQQLSELLHEPGVEVAGPLPPDIQSTTIFSIGIGSRSENVVISREFCSYLTSTRTAEAKLRYGMEPA